MFVLEQNQRQHFLECWCTLTCIVSSARSYFSHGAPLQSCRLLQMQQCNPLRCSFIPSNKLNATQSNSRIKQTNATIKEHMQSKSHCTDATGIQQSRTEQNTCGTQTPESAIFTMQIDKIIRDGHANAGNANIHPFIRIYCQQYAPICAMRDWKILAEDHPQKECHVITYILSQLFDYQ